MKVHIKKALDEINKTLHYYNEDFKGKFVCPICLTNFDITDNENISEGHLIPESVGGKLSVPLCKRCNNKAGERIDKWFGEYIKLSKSEKPLNDAKIKKVLIEGIPYQAELKHGNNVFGLSIREDHNNPKNLKLLNGFSENDYLNIEVELEVIKHQDMIPLGFLTMAYLLGFYLHGYTWVFQNSLDGVRRAIQSEVNIETNDFYCIRKIKSNEPTVSWGLVRLDNEIYLACQFLGYIVFFSTKTGNSISKDLLSIKKELTQENYLVNYPYQAYPPPHVVTLERKCLLLPDKPFVKTENIMSVVVISNDLHRVDIKRGSLVGFEDC